MEEGAGRRPGREGRGPAAMSTVSSSTTRAGTDGQPGTEARTSTGEGPPARSEALGVTAEVLERPTRRIGRELFDRIGRGPKPWQRAWGDDRFLAVALDDPRVRIQLFRFIDALPALKSPESIRRHLDEYLAEAGDAVPWWMALALRLAPEGSARAGWL